MGVGLGSGAIHITGLVRQSVVRLATLVSQQITNRSFGISINIVCHARPLLTRSTTMTDVIRGAYQAWNFLDAALQSDEDRAILNRSRY